MGVNPIYEPIELLRDDGIRTYSARESATGRAVLLHLFTGAQAQTTEDILGQIQTLKDRKIPELIDSGINEGVLFVVTEYEAGVLSLREWVLTQMDRHGVPRPAGNIDHLTRVGRWRIPVAPPALPAHPPESGPAPQTSAALEFAQQPQTGPGEFTRMFQAGYTPAPMGESAPLVPSPAAPPIVFASPAPAPAYSEQPPRAPGEFTRLFQAGSSPAPLAEAAPLIAPPATPIPQQSLSGAGDFTRMFNAGSAPVPIGEPSPQPIPAPAVATPEVAQQPKSGPGEFTRYFSSPLPSSASETGGLGLGSVRPAPFSAPAPVHAPVPKLPAPSYAPPGEFTRIFGKDELGSMPPAHPAVAPSATPVSSIATPPAPTAGPGEYTRMFGPQSRPIASAPTFTPIPITTPRPEQGAEAKKSQLPLILILAALFIVAVIVVVLFAIKK